MDEVHAIGRVCQPHTRLFVTRWMKDRRGRVSRRYVDTSPEDSEHLRQALEDLGLPWTTPRTIKGPDLEVTLDLAMERGLRAPDLLKARDWLRRSAAPKAALHLSPVSLRRWYPPAPSGDKDRPGQCRGCGLLQWTSAAWGASTCSVCGLVVLALWPFRWTWRQGPTQWPHVARAYHPCWHGRRGMPLLVSGLPEWREPGASWGDL